jgi:hypothetical protein
MVRSAHLVQLLLQLVADELLLLLDLRYRARQGRSAGPSIAPTAATTLRHPRCATSFASTCFSFLSCSSRFISLLVMNSSSCSTIACCGGRGAAA